MSNLRPSPPELQITRSPIDGSVVAERHLATAGELEAALARGAAAAGAWARTPLPERIASLSRMVDAFVARRDAVAAGITEQIGRPIRWSGGEVGGFEARARHMLAIAPEALAPHQPAPIAGFVRRIERAPLGLVLVLSPWNYPYLTAVNAVIPALAAGNVVLLKHSDQTPLAAEEIARAGAAAGLPEGVLQFIHMSHPRTAEAVADPRVAHVCFTGSVEGGRAVQAAARSRFIDVGLELGGKDAAYVRADADIAFAAENVVEGVLFNSGQSCCGVERVYVHRAIWADFLDAAVAAARSWTLGDPRDPSVWLGPVVRQRSADLIHAQIQQALAGGARALLPAADLPSGPWVAPQLFIDVHHGMDLMREETFGPVAGLMPVDSDEEAIQLINDSRYGLTASLWSQDAAAAERLAPELEVGTVFLNRCDYLDPGLAWTGVKDSGRGSTLSALGFLDLTRPRSLHLRLR